MRRLAAIGGLALFLVHLGTGVATGEATLDKASVPGNTEVDLVLEVSVQELVAYNDRIVLSVPAGFSVLNCTSPTGYECGRAAATNPTRTVVTWDNVTPSPQEFGVTPTVRFPFRLRTISTAGEYKFDVDQFYSNGETSRWNGAKGSANPAAFLTVTSTSSPVVTETTAPTSSGPSTDSTTPPASFDSGSFGSPTFSDPLPTPSTPDTTPTTVAAPESTDDTTPGFTATAVSGSGSDGSGFGGVERTLLLLLAAVAVGFPAVGAIRERRPNLRD